ncbi:hypothetical protein [Leisingera sp. ANG59]|uniref:hypothetical protein n=1 Tax=Leisingera sp. ANG59 TaxID=2675221 RepID=UPI001574D2B0|nr:hypothetical protein [Leisingera sp. ANG59]NSY41347.1 hypothetical protein [Leisingera sp. ANG59]
MEDILFWSLTGEARNPLIYRAFLNNRRLGACARFCLMKGLQQDPVTETRRIQILPPRPM